MDSVSSLYVGRVTHSRVHPLHHSFSYRCYLWLVDLDHLPRMPFWLRPFARFEARDHLGEPDRTIKANVTTFLDQHGIDLDGGRVLMLANARVLGYVFNPLSVHWCYDGDGHLAALLAEVHNTYGDRHVYLLSPDVSGRAEADKELYVSPFFDTDGRYEMRFSPPGEQLSVAMSLHRQGGTPFSASLRGRRRPATVGAVALASLRYPLMPLWVSALIRFQGVRLWLRRLPVVSRPDHPRQEGVQ
ncbi:MAG: DUF1365 domain-containing protein [Actinomycetota bacterium]|nr:DUF1365 domain-containing protein [Actinomycetota bacterium]